MQEEIIKIIKEKTNKTPKVTDRLFRSGLSKIAVLELVMEIEGKFGVQIPDEELARVNTIQDLINVCNLVTESAN